MVRGEHGIISNSSSVRGFESSRKDNQSHIMKKDTNLIMSLNTFEGRSRSIAAPSLTNKKKGIVIFNYNT